MFEDFDLMTTLLRTSAGSALGLVIALFYMYKGDSNKSFVITLVLFPAIIGAVISIVNGNVGIGVAVIGAFSLVRFRSIPRISQRDWIYFLFDGSRAGNRHGAYPLCGGVHLVGGRGINVAL